MILFLFFLGKTSLPRRCPKSTFRRAQDVHRSRQRQRKPIKRQIELHYYVSFTCIRYGWLWRGRVHSNARVHGVYALLTRRKIIIHHRTVNVQSRSYTPFTFAVISATNRIDKNSDTGPAALVRVFKRQGLSTFSGK
jgi:hypothetical protein